MVKKLAAQSNYFQQPISPLSFNSYYINRFRAAHRLLVLHHRHFLTVRHRLSSLPCTLAVMAAVAEGLQVLQVERCTAPIDRDNMVDYLRRRMPVAFQALLAQRLLLQFDQTQFPPYGRPVELRIGMAASRLRFVLRHPRTTDSAFKVRHSQKIISGFNGRS